MGRHKSKQPIQKPGNLRKRLLVSGAVILLVVGVTAAFLITNQPVTWESVPIKGSAHVEVGSIVRVEGVDPPSSGDHYEETATRGFHEAVVDDGYLIHNLEHGYIIIWYDCTQLGDVACQTLKADIQKTIDDLATYKLVGAPREGMETPIVLTSWGKIDRLTSYNTRRVETFIRANHNKAPEPWAP